MDHQEGLDANRPPFNEKDLNAILKGLEDPLFVKVMQCKTTKHDWEKTKNCLSRGFHSKKIQTSNIQRTV